MHWHQYSKFGRILPTFRVLRLNFSALNFKRLSLPITKRSLWLSAYKMEEAIDKLEKNPYFKKYEKQIVNFVNDDPSQFLSRAQDVAENIDNEKGGHTFSRPATKGNSPLPKGAYAFEPRKRLESIMETQLLENKTPKEIEYIWIQHFSTKDAISGVLPLKLYDKLQERAFKYPTFIFPLPRDHGYEFILAQWAANEIHFTPLINFQAHKENAPECLTMVHYTDLCLSKGIVLMYGEFNKKIANTHDAQCLANQVQLYYGGDNPQKLALLEKFTFSPNEFKHTDLISQLEELDLGALAKKESKQC